MSLLFCACHSADFGKECPALLAGESPVTPSNNPTVTNTAVVVAQNPNFPCEELVCIASGGVGGYCTGSCNASNPCPDGFTCRKVQAVGAFSTAKFCAWKECRVAQDCGSKDDFCCNAVANASPDRAYRLCAFKHGACL